MKPVEGITQLLVRWSEGSKDALDQLMPLVNDELHKLAHLYLRRERLNHTLQPTALVKRSISETRGAGTPQLAKPCSVLRTDCEDDAEHSR